MAIMNVYNGSQHIVKEPVCNGSKRSNDYGHGFYTTENGDLARERACSDNRDGYVNSYEADLEDLSILRLNSPDCSVLNWLAILAKYRTFWQNGSVAAEAKEYLMRHFFIDPTGFDVIIGYRADDSYFTFAQDFVSGPFPWLSCQKLCTLANLANRSCLKAGRPSRDCALPERNR